MVFQQTGNISPDMKQRHLFNNTVQSLLPKQIEITATQVHNKSPTIGEGGFNFSLPLVNQNAD